MPLALVALLVVLTPLSLLAAAPFTDLTGGVHDANIGAIYDAGITRGCVPNVSYCPTANVTREEMASFLARTAGLGSNPPVANAKTAQTANQATNATNAVNAVNATNATNATHAGNANTVGGYAPSGLTRVARGVGYPYPGTTTLTLTAAYQTIATVTITAPTAGFVLLTGSATIQAPGSCTFPGCYIEARLHDVGDATLSGTSPSHFVGLPTGAAGDLVFTYVYPVGGAGAKSYIYEARIQSGGTSVVAYSGLLTALYVPFGSTGTSAP